MEKFAGYGFNKSHAAAYSLLAYHTAWIKVHCTAEFYAANMTVEADNTDKLKVLLADAKLFGVSFEPPDVNRGTLALRAGRRQHACATAWAPSRAPGRAPSRPSLRHAKARDGGGGGPFRSLFDFCARVDRQRVNKRAVEALIKAGAFDAAARRGRPVAPRCWPASALAFDWAETQAANAVAGRAVRLRPTIARQQHAGAGAGARAGRGTCASAWCSEKAALGFYLSGHLFDA